MSREKQMSLDEAISHAREVAETREDLCEECRQEHSQLADWLEELKQYRKQSEGEWIRTNEMTVSDFTLVNVTGVFRCSCCGELKSSLADTSSELFAKLHPYCEKCGAKMKGGAE